MKKRITFMMVLMLVVTLISGCGKTFLSRLFRSDHGEFTEILTDFLDAANQNDKKKIEKLFAKNVSGEKFEKQLDKFLEFYSETIKDGTLDKDSILMRVTGSQDRNFYRIMDSGAKITKGNQTYCGDEIIRIKLVNEEEVLETIYEKDSEND